ncbi:MAG: PilZ domain-containing protein [Planctomycetota bacterium]
MVQPSKPHLDAVVSTLRVSETEQHRLLQELDHAGGRPAGGPERRRSPRKPVPAHLSVCLEVHHPGGTSHKFWARARNLSDSGVGLLHGGFLHEKTRCVVEMIHDGVALVRIPARVVRCRYVRSSVHEVGLQFDEPICAEAILKAEKTEVHRPKPDADDAKPLPRLAGRVLYVDPIEADRRYVSHRLAQLGLTFRAITDTLRSLEFVQAERFDLVLTELRLRPDPAQYLVRRLRSGGHEMPIVVVGHSIPQATAKQLTEHGVQACLNKPFAFDKFAELLARHLPEAGSDTDPPGEALRSEHWEDPAFRPMLFDYVEQLFRTIDRLDEQMLRPDAGRDPVETAHEFAATAGLYGYPKLFEAGSELVTLLTLEPLPTDMITEHLQSLRDLADRVRLGVA